MFNRVQTTIWAPATMVCGMSLITAAVVVLMRGDLAFISLFAIAELLLLSLVLCSGVWRIGLVAWNANSLVILVGVYGITFGLMTFLALSAGMSRIAVSTNWGGFYVGLLATPLVGIAAGIGRFVRMRKLQDARFTTDAEYGRALLGRGVRAFVMASILAIGTAQFASWSFENKFWPVTAARYRMVKVIEAGPVSGDILNMRPGVSSARPIPGIAGYCVALVIGRSSPAIPAGAQLQVWQDVGTGHQVLTSPILLANLTQTQLDALRANTGTQAVLDAIAKAVRDTAPQSAIDGPGQTSVKFISLPELL